MWVVFGKDGSCIYLRTRTISGDVLSGALFTIARRTDGVTDGVTDTKRTQDDAVQLENLRGASYAQS